MSEAAVVLLACQGMLFTVWAFLAFRFLFALRNDAVVATGSVMPGLRATLRAFRGALTEPRYFSVRWRLFSTTVLLLLLSGLVPIALR
ncbi:hypothetical protein [Nitratireductor indicus]|uniref:Uncharacterized protein n=1 Tax=Nitratireductor indicus C115 TaxID=1231190 RepID=K2NQI5_9HYPH|nr:hypothetical protein [Nitratireductor indicus]EKF41610.1 hypothetical protein NA8A_15416 [Nitratireductor indicus C115]MDS1136138.1 hypothetical protein [Nitratireductor indicus]SFQ70432.1 hypothetical protein SAMN05216176_110146 [Nitratireductor indicus]